MIRLREYFLKTRQKPGVQKQKKTKAGMNGKAHQVSALKVEASRLPPFSLNHSFHIGGANPYDRKPKGPNNELCIS